MAVVQASPTERPIILFTSTNELEAGLDLIRQSPKDSGRVELIVCRPAVGKREELNQAVLDVDRGLDGDNWLARGDRHTADRRAHPDMQLNLMNARTIALIAQTRERWKLAGDQFYIDLDLSNENLPVGSLLAIGEAVIEVTAEPHLGCSKFSRRYGREATKFVNSKIGKMLNLRGINAKVISSGKVDLGASIRKIDG